MEAVQMKRRLVLGVIVALVSSALFGGIASAHVHGVTPLNQISVDSANSGGLATNDTPAAAANGGPITGLIPRDTGEAPLTGGDGGFGATDDNAP
jgi:hypothetical protein